MISKNFKREEFACKCGCGFDTVDVKLMEVLQWLRYVLDAPITITSGCRCSDHNNKIGGSKLSQHKLGRAADIKTGYKPQYVADILNEMYEDEISIGVYDTFVHVDTRTDGGKRWGF